MVDPEKDRVLRKQLGLAAQEDIPTVFLSSRSHAHPFEAFHKLAVDGFDLSWIKSSARGQGRLQLRHLVSPVAQV